MKKQVLAMGGGGFSMEPENLALDRFLLSASRTLGASLGDLGVSIEG